MPEPGPQPNIAHVGSIPIVTKPIEDHSELLLDGDLRILRIVVEDGIVAHGLKECVKGGWVDTEMTTEDFRSAMDPFRKGELELGAILDDWPTWIKGTVTMEFLKGV